MSLASVAAGVEPEVAFNRHWAEQAFLVKPAGRSTGGTNLPFSFVYGGKHSSEFINDWKHEVKDEKVGEMTNRRTLILTDPATGLEVRCVCFMYLDTAGVDWTLYFTNKGSKDSPVIEQVKAVDARVSLGGGHVVIHRLNGSPCKVDDWLPFDQPVPDGQTIKFTATNGRSSNVSPWFNVASSNGGVVTAIGWSGQWCASVESKGGQVRIEAGMQNLHAVLHPGESIRSPRILQLHWQGGDAFRAYNLFRRTMFAHIMVRINGQLVVPPIVHLSTSFYELNASNEQNVLSHLESLKGLGFEMFWLDAYWTGPSGFPNSMGNYGLPIERVEPKDRFPHGLKAIGDAVAKEGLRFVLWFEPERVVAGTLIAKEHSEWVMSPSGDGSGLYNLGIPAARQYMTDYLNAAIKAYKVSCLRIDYNIDPLRSWTFMDAKDPNRAGMTEMRYVEGLYRMWDDILKANPSLFIDNCASGGRRIDLEAMSRSIPLWRSDNTCDMLDKKAATVLLAAIKNQVMSAGLNRYVPFSTAGQMGATPYLFRSGFNAGIAFSEDVRPKDYPRALLQQGIAEGQRIRKYFFGNFYPLVEVTTSPRDWCIMQYHRPEENDGMVMAFRRDQSPGKNYECRLREIDPAADYRVTMYRTYEPEEPLTMKGAALQKLMIEIGESPGSVLLEYTKKKEGVSTMIQGLSGARAVPSAADLSSDTLRQLKSPVSGYRGELSNVEILPGGVLALPPGPDLAKMAEAALHYLGNNPVPENKYQCRFWNMLLLCPPAPLPDPSKDPLDGITIGDTESRNDIAFNQMREMCGSEFGRKAQDEVHKRLVGYLRSTPGQLGDDMCWCYLYCGSPDGDSPYAFPWTTGKLLQSEVDLYRLTGEENHKKLARRIFEGLRKAASWDKGRAFYPNGMQGFKPGKNARGYEGHYPPVIGPVTYYWRHCKDPEALEFARAMAEGFLADLQPNHRHQPDGSVRGHNHVLMHAVRGVAELGAETREERYLQWAKAAYQYYNDNGFDTGWLPEISSGSGSEKGHDHHTEMCLVADMTEIELWLARGGMPGYWDRVDRTIRNLVVPCQFVLTPAIEALWREVNKDKPLAQVDRSIQLLKDFQGGFLSGPTPNDLVFEVNPKVGHHGSAVYQGRKIVFDMMGCCPPEGMRAIYLAWRDAVVETPEGILINLAFNRDSPKASVVSQMPRKGQLAVTAKVEADFLLRPPGWALRSAVQARRGEKPIEIRWGGPAQAYVVFPKVKPGETLEIAWPLVKFTQRVSHKIFDGSVQRAYTYSWVGSSVTAVDPPGEWLPLYGSEQRR